jgi:hypothetical protein
MKDFTLVSLKAIKPASNTDVTGDDSQKEKATFNLSTTVLKDLEDTWVHLKRAAKGTRITKTLIVETALLLAIKDYQERGEDSAVFKSIHLA